MDYNPPLTKTEMKILVFNKVKQKGMTYDEAYEELKMEIKNIKQTHILIEEQQKKREQRKRRNDRKR